MLLTKANILKSKDITTETVTVEEWGGDVIIQTMTGTSRDRFEASCLNDDNTRNLTNFRAKLVSACAVDNKGCLLFDNDDDIIALGKKSGAALDTLYDVAQRINKMSESDVEDTAKK